MLIILGILLGLYGLYCAVAVYVEKSDSKTASVATARATESISPDLLYSAISDVRKAYNVPALRYNSALNTTAEAKCKDMVDNQYYEHINPKTGEKHYSKISELIPKVVYESENLNKGTFMNNQEVVDSWMSSPKHKGAIIDPKYTDTGFAVCEDRGVTLTVEHFAQVAQ